MKRIILFITLLALLAPAAVLAQAGGPAASVMAWMKDNMGMEIGSVTIDGTSYSKVVLAPEVRIGRLKLGLYLPVIYNDDLFNPSTWYEPGGNNEWDFGAGYWGVNTFKAVMDVAADLDSGETIASVTFSVTDADGAAVADVVTAHTESVSRTDFRVEAPAAGTYTLTAVFTHTDGQVVTHTARLIVA